MRRQKAGSKKKEGSLKVLHLRAVKPQAKTLQKLFSKHGIKKAFKNVKKYLIKLSINTKRLPVKIIQHIDL